MSTPRILVALASTALLAGCTIQEDPRTAAARSYVREVTGDDLKGSSRLQIQTTGVTTDGRFAKFRGYVRSKFDQPVDGVRYLVTLHGDAPDYKVLDRWQREVDTTIEPGERANMNLDVESMYFGSYGIRNVNIDAVPVKVGGNLVPPPPGWK